MAAQFVFIKAKEYKVVNWIDGVVYVTTFSASGRESTVKSAKTIAAVMAALVEAAHAEALAYDATLCVDEGCPQHGTLHQCVKLETVRADQVQAGDVLRVGNGENETVRGMIEGDNEIRFFWESGAVMRSAYPHTMVTRVVQA